MDEQTLTYCIICGKTGELFVCDSCPRSFHGGCLPSQPPSSNPEEKWSCHFCREDDASASDEINWQSSYHILKSHLLLTKDIQQMKVICTLREIVRFLMNDHFGEIFSVPVDLTEYPDYADRVKRPMDLGTVLSQSDRGDFFMEKDSVLSIIKDISLIWENCFIYNKKGSLIYRMAVEQRKKFVTLMQRYVADKLDEHQLQVVRELPSHISGVLDQLRSISYPKCIISYCTEIDLITLPQCNCKCRTKLVVPSSVKYPIETADLDKILQDLEIKTYNYRIVCRTCGNSINEAAKDSTRRMCPMCRKLFQPRTFEKWLNMVEKNEAREAITLTMKILDRIKAEKPVACKSNQISDEAEVSLADDLIDTDDAFSLDFSFDSEIDMNDVCDVFAVRNSQTEDRNKGKSSTAEKEEYLQNLSRNMKLRQNFLPSIVYDQKCHNCHSRRPKLIAFGCPFGVKHSFCEKHAKSHLDLQNITLEEIVSRMKHCPICCLECVCSKCALDRENKWKGKPKTAAYPRLIGCKDQETTKDIMYGAAAQGSRVNNADYDIPMMPNTVRNKVKKQSATSKRDITLDFGSDNDELDAEINVPQAVGNRSTRKYRNVSGPKRDVTDRIDHIDIGEDISLDEMFCKMQALKERLFSKINKDLDRLEGTKKHRDDLCLKIKESKERCDRLEAKVKWHRNKLKDSKCSSGPYYISNGTRDLHQIEDFSQFLTWMLGKHEKEWNDELTAFGTLNGEKRTLDTTLKELEQQCNHWKKQMHYFSAECVECSGTWSRIRQPLVSTQRKKSRKEDSSPTLKSPQMVACAMSRAEDDDSVIIID